MQKNIKCHSRSIWRRLELLVELLLLEGRLLFNFSSLNLLKQLTGHRSVTALDEFSQLLISGKLATMPRMTFNFCNLLISKTQGNIISSMPNSSQMKKSIMVMYERNQGLSVHSRYSISIKGFMVVSQQYCIHFFFSVSHVGLGRFAQVIPSIAIATSLRLVMLSIFALSSMLYPTILSRLPFSMMYIIAAILPVTMKSPSCRKGISLKIQSLASVSLNLFHSSGLKKWSRQGRCKYSQSNLRICPLALKGQYPMTKVSESMGGSLLLSRSISVTLLSFLINIYFLTSNC